MNNIYTNLIDSITDELKVFNLNEDVQFSISKIDEYDLQINNLVKYNKEKFFLKLQEKIVEIIKESQIFETVDKNDIGFINLSLNHRFLMNKITNTKMILLIIKNIKLFLIMEDQILVNHYMLDICVL